jgi:hypothetical protein
MTSRRGFLAWLLVGLGVACADPAAPDADVPPPVDVQVAALSMHVIGLEWEAVNSPEVIGYEVQRRANFTGPFEPLDAAVPQGSPQLPVTFDDADLEPDTFYGYRVVALTRRGGRSAPSTVRAARTPPLPGLFVTTRTQVAGEKAVDADGYIVSITGQGDPLNDAIGLNDGRRFSPLSPGAYQITLDGLAAQCRLSGQPVPTSACIPSTACGSTYPAPIPTSGPSWGSLRRAVTAWTPTDTP